MKRTLSGIAVLGLVVLGLGVAPSAAWAATTTVSGVVTDEGLNPVQGAKVRYLTANSEYDYYTDAAGHYGGPISPESYVVKFEAAGFAAEYFDDSATLAGATSVAIAAGSSTVADAALGTGSLLMGTITSYTGTPVQAGVQLFSENDGWKSIDYIQSSAVDGTYTFDGLSAGHYKVSVFSPDSDDLVDEWYSDRLTEVEATVITVPTAGTATADVELAEGATIGGMVTNTIGTPVEMQLFASNTIQPDSVRGWTSGGTYSLPGLAPADYTISTYALEHDGFFAPVSVGPVTAAVGSPAAADFVLTPALPDESEFVDEIAPLTGPLVVAQGGTYTWTVANDDDSDVYGILYSNPVFLGAAPSAIDGVATLTLTIPADTTPGDHKLTVSSYDEGNKEATIVTRDYFDLTVVASSVPVVDPGRDPANGETPQTAVDSPRGAPSLANTGASSSAWLLGAAALLLLVGVVASVGRRRRV